MVIYSFMYSLVNIWLSENIIRNLTYAIDSHAFWSYYTFITSYNLFIKSGDSKYYD